MSQKKTKPGKREILLQLISYVPELIFYAIRGIFGGIVRLFKYLN